MRAWLGVILLTLWAVSSLARALPVQQGAITDRLGLLTDAQRREIERSAQRAFAAQSEVAILLVSRSDGADHRAYATRVFNAWTLGSAHNDRGVLIYLALDDRAAEIILGNGVDGAAEEAVANQIMQETMVPRLRQGEVGAAMVAGAHRVVEEILGVPPPVDDVSAPKIESADLSVEYGSNEHSASGLLAPPDRPTAANAPLQSSARQRFTEWPWLAGGAGGLGVVAWSAFRWWRRRQPPACLTCRQPMELLAEDADDAELSPVERTEERLRSVDYDVWHCARCHQVQKRRYGRWFTRYRACPKCKGVTKQSKETTVKWPTQVNTGLMQIDEHCQHCGHQARDYRVLPVLPKISSASRSKSSRSSGSSRSSRGGSSGRGASGRW